MSPKKEKEIEQPETEVKEDRSLQILQTLAEINDKRFYYRIVEKEYFLEGKKGSFYSLERGELVQLMDSKAQGKARPKKMFTLPKDTTIINALIEGMKKIPDWKK